MYCDVILRFSKSCGGHSAPIVYLFSCAKKRIIIHVSAFSLPLFFSYWYSFLLLCYILGAFFHIYCHSKNKKRRKPSEEVCQLICCPIVAQHGGFVKGDLCPM